MQFLVKTSGVKSKNLHSQQTRSDSDASGSYLSSKTAVLQFHPS